MILLLIGFISFIPIIDIFFTNHIYSFPTHKFSCIFSKYIIYFNLIVNLIMIYYIPLKIIFYRYFVELFIINFCFKWLLDRPRPNQNKNYFGLKNIVLSKNWLKYQSFPSGHVATVFCTYFIINNLYLKYFYLFLIFITIYSRINKGAHYFSDCIWAIIISYYSLVNYSFIDNFIINIF